MKTIRIAMLSAVAALCLAGCEAYYGEPVTTRQSIDGNYTAVKVSNAFDVTVSDTATAATVTVPERMVDKVKLQVRNGVLEIGFKKTLSFTIGECSVILPLNSNVKDLDLSGASSYAGDLQGNRSEVDISGSSSFRGNIAASEIDFEISGASDARCTATADKIDAEVSGSSQVTLSGDCTGTMDIEVSGSSDLHAEGLTTNAVTGDVSGSSRVKVTVCERIAVNVSGASTVTYGLSSPDCHPSYGCTTSGASTVSPR